MLADLLALTGDLPSWTPRSGPSGGENWQMEHPERVTIGFDRAASAYQRGRPGYPGAILDVFAAEVAGGFGAGSRALDVGAGTGKFTALLADSGAEVFALELVPAMLAELAEVLPDVHPLSAEAHAVPLADGSIDLVTAATAFHWFADDEAIAELGRVLRVGGILATVSNRRGTSDPFGADFEAVLARRRPAMAPPAAPVAALFARSGLFVRSAVAEVSHVVEHDRDQLVDLALSMSYIAPLAEDARAVVVAEVDALVPTSGLVPLGYTSEVVCFRREDVAAH